MKKFLYLGALFASAWAHGSNSATQTVTFSVAAINELSVTGNPGTLSVTSAAAGAEPNAVSDSSTSYAITTNQSGQKITGSINTAMPSGTQLQVTLAAPGGASSAGAVTLSTTATNLVTGISTVAQSGNALTYQFSATAAAGQINATSRIVTLTLTAGP